MKLWPVEHIFPHFWAWLLLYSAITPKNEGKYVVKVFNWSEVHLSKMTCYKIHTLVHKYFLFSIFFFRCSTLRVHLIQIQQAQQQAQPQLMELLVNVLWTHSKRLAVVDPHQSFADQMMDNIVSLQSRWVSVHTASFCNITIQWTSHDSAAFWGKVQIWYFVTIIVLTYCEKKLF